MELKNLSKNKIIFIAILGVLIILILILALSMNSQTKGTDKKVAEKNLSVWVVGDNKAGYAKLIEAFKNSDPGNKNASIDISVFPTYLDYKTTLKAAFMNNKGPDVFVLNNNDSVDEISGEIVGLNSDFISVDYIRNNFPPVFGNGLILSYEQDGKTMEFLTGVPLGFDTLSTIYNTKNLMGKDLSTWAGINNAIIEITNKIPNEVPVALGGGAGITNSADIFAQMLIQDGMTSITSKQGKPDNTISIYSSYASSRGENKFDNLASLIKSSGETDISLLSKGKISIMFGYLKDLKKIEKATNSSTKNLLRVVPFPSGFGQDSKNLVSYNYFLINKNSISPDLANKFLQYLVSENGQRTYSQNFKYSLPTHVKILEEIAEQKVSNNLVIRYKNFFNSQMSYTSFDKGIIELFDGRIPEVLDSLNVKSDFTNLQNTILCIYKKISTFESLESNCNY